MEKWRMLDQQTAASLRAQAKAQCNASAINGIAGSDIDPEALSLCNRHLQQAELAGRINVSTADVRAVPELAQGTVILTNPPYGERMGDRKQAETIYRDLFALHLATPNSRLCVITAHPGFERVVGRKAARRRRLYNGRLECDYLIY